MTSSLPIFLSLYYLFLPIVSDLRLFMIKIEKAFSDSLSVYHVQFSSCCSRCMWSYIQNGMICLFPLVLVVGTSACCVVASLSFIICQNTFSSDNKYDMIYVFINLDHCLRKRKTKQSEKAILTLMLCILYHLYVFISVSLRGSLSDKLSSIQNNEKGTR